MKKLKYWSIGGFAAIILTGTLFHFIYDWSNNNLILAAFFPVNESVWEHLKLGLYGVLTFSLAEYIAIGKLTRNYFLAKLTGIIVISMTILVVYYSYTHFTEKSILAVDIASFVLGVFLCQLISLRIFRLEISGSLNMAAFILLFMICFTFAVFTFYPPKIEIFRDKRTDTYGIFDKPTYRKN